MKSIFAIAVSVPLSLFGCASGPGWFAASDAAPMQFQLYSCEQIDAELDRLYSLRLEQLGGRTDDAAMPDKSSAAGSRPSWTTLFAAGGDNEEDAKFSRLKGEYLALMHLSGEKQCELVNGSAESGDGMVPQNLPVAQKMMGRETYRSYTLLASGKVVADPPTVMAGARSIPVKAVALPAIFRKTRGDVCDQHVSRGDYCWWSPPGNYSMCPALASFAECKALYGSGCQLGHGKVLPLC